MKTSSKTWRSIFAMLMSVLLVLSTLSPMQVHASDKAVENEFGARFWHDEPTNGFYINSANRYILETVKNPSFGTAAGEWSVLDLLRGMHLGYDYMNHIPSDYFDGYINRFEETISEALYENEYIDRNKSTEYSRLMLTLGSLGYDAKEVGIPSDKYDFIEDLSTSFNFAKKQGINGPIWEVIALNTVGYELYDAEYLGIPESDVNTVGKMIEYTLSTQTSDGGWDLSAKVADPDMTGMALQSLAPYYLNEDLFNELGIATTYHDFKIVVERAIKVLADIQQDNGGYKSWGTPNSESIAQVIVALTELNIDPLASSIELPTINETVSFVKGEHTVISAILEYYAPATGSEPWIGGFKHVLNSSVNAMATDQATYALIAYERYKNNLNSLYDMTDMMNGEYKTLQANTYTATFGDDVQQVSPYAVIELPSAENTKGQLFTSWNTAQDGSGTTYVAGEKLIMPEQNITLYPQYEVDPNAVIIDVIDQITALPSHIEFTEEHKLALDAAREAYDALTEEQQALVTNYNVLVEKENAYTAAEEAGIANAPLVSISFEEKEIDVVRKETYQAEVIFNPANTSDDKTLSWSSSQSIVASVNQNGVITAKENGYATITAKTANGLTASIKINVVSPLTNFKLDNASQTISQGYTQLIAHTFVPSNTTDDRTVIWTSSDESIATVDPNGKVTGVNVGTATITAQIGAFTKTTTIEVVEASTAGVVYVSFEDFASREDGGGDFPEQLGVLIPKTAVPFEEGDTIADVTIRLLDEHGIVADYWGDTKSGFYLSAINGFELPNGEYIDTFGEFSAGQMSGWMITWNNWFINEGASQFFVEEGDIIRWQMTTQLGADIGTSWDNPSAQITGLEIDPKYGTLSPEFSEEEEYYTLTVPADVDAIQIEALLSNYWSIVTYTANGEQYKLLRDIPIEDGTVIEVYSAYAEYAGNPPSDEDWLYITIDKEEPTIDLAVQAVVEQIQALPALIAYEETHKLALTEARVAYEALNDLQKEQVSNYATLVEKENAYTVAEELANVPLVSISFKESEIGIIQNQPYQAEVIFNPANTTDDKTITWSSNKSYLISVDQNGVITPKTAGSATITAKTANGLTATMQVKTLIPLTDFNLDKTEYQINQSLAQTISTKFTPANTSDDKTITWSSSDENIATVDAKGNVTAVNLGTATITAKVGAFTRTATVKVIPYNPITSVTVSTEEVELDRGQTTTITTTYAPLDTTDSTVAKWSSSNSSVASVSQQGVITANARGTASITVKIGNISKKITVNVNDEVKGTVYVSFEDYAARVEGGEEFPEPLGTLIEKTAVPFYEGDSIADVTVRLLDQLGIIANYQGDTKDSFYLSSITDFTTPAGDYIIGHNFGEFTAGQMSGWMISSNNWFINMGASAFEVEDGDIIRWQMTSQYGADIGSSYDNPSAEITGLNIDLKYGTLSPAFSEDKEEYTLTVPADVDAIQIEALQSNYWSIVTYTADGKQYKLLRDIPVEDGTEIEIYSAYAEYAGNPPSDEDWLYITIEKEPPAADEALQAVVDQILALPALITYDGTHKHALEQARAAYEALNDIQKALVFNYPTLVEKENAYKVAEELSNATVPLSEITVKEAVITLTVGDTHTPQVAFLPEDTTDSKALAFESSNASIVKAENGVLTALSKGQATVTIKAANDLTATITVNVQEKQEKQETPETPAPPEEPVVDEILQDVINKIDALPMVITLDEAHKLALEEARASYNALSDVQKLLVSNYDVLQLKENAFGLLVEAIEKLEVLEEKPEVPEEKPVVPEEKPEVPEEKPVVPEEKPEVPEEKPEVPEDKPVVPEEKPEVSEEKPVVPEEKTVVPNVIPETPNDTGSVPVSPTNPAPKPVVPEEKPATLPTEMSKTEGKQQATVNPATNPQAAVVTVQSAEGIQISIPKAALQTESVDVVLQVAKQGLQINFEAQGQAVSLKKHAAIAIPAEVLSPKDGTVLLRRLPDGSLAAAPYTVVNGEFVLKTATSGEFVVSTASKTFKDIKNDGHKFYIEELAKRHIVNGKADEVYDPKEGVTRGQFSAMIVRAIDLQAGNEQQFSDAKANQFAQELQALVEIGVLKGDGNQLKPGATVTRHQAALMMERLFKHLEIDLPEVSDEELNFSDAEKIPEGSKQSIALMQKLGIFTGKDDGRFDPNGQLTRSQMSKVIYKALTYAEMM